MSALHCINNVLTFLGSSCVQSALKLRPFAAELIPPEVSTRASDQARSDHESARWVCLITNNEWQALATIAFLDDGVYGSGPPELLSFGQTKLSTKPEESNVAKTMAATAQECFQHIQKDVLDTLFIVDN